MRKPLVLLLAALVFAIPAVAGTLGGVTMPDRITVDGDELVLNGQALRSKFLIKVYVAGLYLPAKERDAGKVLAADTPRRTVLHFVYDVDKAKICEAWNEGLEANTPKASAALKRDFVKLCGWMEDIEKGEKLVFTYLPGTGTAIEVGGKEKGTIAGKPFADALWAAWIGEHPGPGEGFKKGLLGG